MKVGSDMTEESIYLRWLSQKILLRVFESRKKKLEFFDVAWQICRQVTIASQDFSSTEQNERRYLCGGLGGAKAFLKSNARVSQKNG